MTGDLTVQAGGAGVSGNTLRPASEVTFSVNGVTNPATGVQYDWSVQYNSDAPQIYTDNGTALDFPIPSSTTIGSYTVSVTARAIGYTDLAGAKRVFTVAAAAMTGDLTVQAGGEGVINDHTLRPASNVTFKVNGITTPATGVTYDWTVKYNNDVSPATFPNKGKNLDFSVPSTATGENYTVWVTAKADGYAAQSGTQKVFAVSPAEMTGNISVAVTGDGVTNGANGSIIIRPKSTVTFAIQNGITKPADGITYEWAVTGSPTITPPAGATTATVWTVNTMPDVSVETAYTIKVTARKDGYNPKETSLPVSVTPATLAGTLQISVSSPATNTDGSLRPGAPVEFQATGLTGLPAGVTYAWTWTPPAASPSNGTANTWETNTGGGEGNGTIAVTVQADGYASQQLTKSVTIKKGELNGTPEIAVVTGMPAANPNGSFRPGSQVQFRVDGLTNPPTGVQYAWTWTSPPGTTTSGTTADNTWTTGIGTTEGIGTVTVTVKANGYADKATNRTVSVQKANMRGALSIVPTGTMRTIDNTLCFLPASLVRFTAGLTNPPAGVTYEWKITHTNSGATATTGTNSYIDYPATLFNPNKVAGDLLTIELTAKADGYAEKITTLNAKIRCFPFLFSEAVPKITYTSGGGSTIYTGADVIFAAPVITDPDNGANATYTWKASGDNGLNISGSGSGLQWTTNAPATPTAGFGATVTINQTGYCEDTRSLPGLSVNCQQQSGVLTAYADGKSTGDIYFNKQQNLTLYATYNGTETADSYTWNIGGQYEKTTSVANHTIDVSEQSIKNLTPASTPYTLTVKAIKGSCTLQTVTYDIFIIDCPYIGNDLLIDATHSCAPISTSQAPYQAYIKVGEQIYRIVRLPDNNSSFHWWFAENSRMGTSTYDKDGIKYYAYSLASNACPSTNGWSVPTQAQWSDLFTAIGASGNYGVDLRSPEFGSGSNGYGFSATNTSYYNNGGSFSGDNGAFAWTSTSDKSIRIQSTAAPSNDFTMSSGYAPVRCIK